MGIILSAYLWSYVLLQVPNGRAAGSIWCQMAGAYRDIFLGPGVLYPIFRSFGQRFFDYELLRLPLIFPL
jgi:hypothetical protein